MLRSAFKTIASRAVRRVARGGRAVTSQPLANETQGHLCPGFKLPTSRSYVFTSPLLSFGVRGLASSSAVESNLIKVLKSELKHEKENFEVPEEVSEGPPEPFQVDEKAGSGVLLLRRSYGSEDVAVTVGIQGEEYVPEGEGEDEMEGDDEGHQGEDEGMVPLLPATVTIKKGAGASGLEFHCNIDSRNQFSIVQVSLAKEDEADESVAYGGPDFEMLDPEAQSAFHQYLEARGCTEELAAYIKAAVMEKEQREYMRWLDGVLKVLGKDK